MKIVTELSPLFSVECKPQYMKIGHLLEQCAEVQEEEEEEEEDEEEQECNVTPGKPSLGHQKYSSEGKTKTYVDKLEKYGTAKFNSIHGFHFNNYYF